MPWPAWALGAALVTCIAPAAFGYTDPELAKLQAEVKQLRRQIYELHQYDPAPADPAPEVGPLMAGWDRGFYLASADENYRLHIGGWIQPRYEYQNRSDRDPEATSSFFMRRVRLDVRGHVFTPDLTFRVLSEHARTSDLRDGCINYAFTPGFQVRFGQFTAPFQWHRYVSPRRQHFADRGVPSETFGWFQGRDVGVMTHGRLGDDKLVYGIGFFDGAGRNVATSNSDGHMATGTREREWGVGWNLYHRGHDWKTRLNLLRHDFALAHDQRFLVEHHLQF